MICRIGRKGAPRRIEHVRACLELLQRMDFSSKLAGSRANPRGRTTRDLRPMDSQTQPKLGVTHPLAGTKMAGADIIIQVLADEGVETIFGYSGGAILPTYDAVFRYNAAHG